MTDNLTFDQLPKAVKNLVEEVNELRNLLLSMEPRVNNQPEQWLDLNDLIKYDPEKRTKPTWYSKISRNEVPYYKRGKKVYFLKSEIDEWLREGKCKSNSEIEEESSSYLLKNKKG